MNGLNRFLGDSPLRVAIKLIVISFLVGIVMAAFNLTPWDVLYRIEDFFLGIWNMGFAALGRFWQYFLLGAVVVVPVFFILRVLNMRGR